MTADEARQLQSLATNVGEFAVALGRLDERIRTLFETQSSAHAEELRYRDERSRECDARHSRLDARLEVIDSRQRILLGFQSRWAGAGALFAFLVVFIGAIASIGRLFGAL